MFSALLFEEKKLLTCSHRTKKSHQSLHVGGNERFPADSLFRKLEIVPEVQLKELAVLSFAMPPLMKQ